MPDGSEFRLLGFVRPEISAQHDGMERPHCHSSGAENSSNHEEVLTAAFLREAMMIRNHGIPAELRVNTDQTQIIYQQGTKETWNKKGEKQIATVGLEEKRAFTLVPSITASGDMLPFQAVFSGKSSLSLPRPGSRGYAESERLGFKLEFSMNASYWSTQKTMGDLVTDIV